MSTLQKEQEFFQYIAGKIIDFVSVNKEISIAEHKREGDFSTHVDVGVENIIVEELKKRFPNDIILAEEGHNYTELSTGRIWIIDPICGTNNLARGIRNFCTNIALADKNELIASCVIDHSQNDYFWSIGEGVYCNDHTIIKNKKRFDTIVDIDFGAVSSVDKKQREKHNRFLKKLITETNYYLISLNSSLSFAYTAIGKVDGFVNIYNHPWDICASSFLIQQAGGIISDLDGKPWSLNSVGAIAAKNQTIHQTLLQLFENC